jgi:hypothetical protein
VEEARSFVDAARHVGHADPDDVTEHLRRATKAFLSGDHASVRAVFEAILPPIASGDIDLGQHELVEEVLGVDARACVAQYVASVYTTTPLRNRADAMVRALEQVEGVGTLSSPIKDMEDVSAGALPDLGAFLPLWVKRLNRFRPSREEWETGRAGWTVLVCDSRLDGRSTKSGSSISQTRAGRITAARYTSLPELNCAARARRRRSQPH